MLPKANDGWWIRTIRVAVIALAISSLPAFHAQTPQSESGKCKMRLLEAPRPLYPPGPVDKDEVLKSPAVAELGINDDGTVKTVRLTRSSGIRRYDKAIIQALKKWRYNAAAAGCGERNATVSVAISPTK